jgi:hypothetical protein
MNFESTRQGVSIPFDLQSRLPVDIERISDAAMTSKLWSWVHRSVSELLQFCIVYLQRKKCWLRAYPL